MFQCSLNINLDIESLSVVIYVIIFIIVYLLMKYCFIAASIYGSEKISGIHKLQKRG